MEIIKIDKNSVVAHFKDYGYQWTRPERVILNAPTKVGCSSVIDSFGVSFKDNIFQGGRK